MEDRLRVYGLTGAQRVGKSTLAKAYAEKNNCLFVQTRVSSVFQQMGMDPKLEYALKERLHCQNAILVDLENQMKEAYEEAEKLGHMGIISDRTPLDLIGYTLADIQRTSTQHIPGHESAEQDVMDYIQACSTVADEWNQIMIIQPGIPVVEAEGKAPGSPAYMMHMNLIYCGMIGSTPLVDIMIMPARILSPETRLKHLERYFE